MKKTALGAAALAVFCLSGSAFAAEEPSLEDRCRAIAQQHQVAADQIEAWVTRCVNHAKPQAQQREGAKQPHTDMQNQNGTGKDKADMHKH